MKKVNPIQWVKGLIEIQGPEKALSMVEYYSQTTFPNGTSNPHAPFYKRALAVIRPRQ